MSAEDRKDLDDQGWKGEELDWLDDLISDREPRQAPRPTETARQPSRTEQTAPPRPEVTARTPGERTGGRQPEPERRTARRDEIDPGAYVPYRPDGDGGDEPVYAREKRRRTNVPLIILIGVLVLGMLFAGWQLGSIFLNYHRDRSAYNELASNAISALPEDAAAQAETKPDDDLSENDLNHARIVSQVPITVDWNYLRSVNSDIVGWLYCPDTVINYPVVQGSDNSFYLDHGFDRQSNTSGALFADIDSVAGITQSNYIIYGHNMKDKSMFGTFQEYVNESYYRQHPVMYFLTPGGSYRVDLIGAHIVEGTTDNFPTYFGSASDYQEYLDGISADFYWMNRDAMNTQYQLLTMSTCTSAAGFSDARLLVHGVLVPIQ